MAITASDPVRSTGDTKAGPAPGAGGPRGELPRRDELAPFRPAILAIRAGATSISVALSAGAFAGLNFWVIGWCLALVVYNVFRIIRPLRYHDDNTSLVRVVIEVGIHVIAVAATGFWASPLVFSLLTAIMVAGFARGFGFALRIGAASALAVAVPEGFAPGYGGDELRISVQWTTELLLVALIAGYARRIVGEADRQHNLALDRLGRLADANALLFSLHRVAQSLPASLDLDEVLDSTMTRLRDLFRVDHISVILADDTSDDWMTVRWHGFRPPARLSQEQLPRSLRRAIETRELISESDLAPTDRWGISTTARSGVYAVLQARSSIVGVVAVESDDPRHFTDRDLELLSGFTEPAALAIDNARWFARLRTVGADEERTRIARDLHDRIGQSLAYLAFELDRVVKVDARGEPVTESLGRLRGDLRGVVGEVRDTLYDLRTDVSETQDVPTTLGEFLARVDERTTAEVELMVDAADRLGLPQEREMWRIAQEAVANAERHAAADHIGVRWRCHQSGATLEVRDDGVGFREGSAGRSDSYGMLGMRERAASIGASLEVVSEPGRGTLVRCQLVEPDAP